MNRLLFSLLLLAACTSAPMQRPFDLQGHRGARGHWPENSIPGMLRALDMGVTTLEMDAVISADRQVLLSHEPFLSHEFCLLPDGGAIPEAEERSYNLYQMTYAEIAAFDCGSKPHPRFPQQQKLRVSKPLLAEVIDSAEAHARRTGRPAPLYNIETKCSPEGDGVYHPEPETFIGLLAEVVRSRNTAARTTIQSFDPRTLQAGRQRHGSLGLKWALLVENEDGLEANLARLGFTPDIYSPDHRLVTAELVQQCRTRGMALIPWTANEPDEIRRLLELGVDGIISDYPDRVAAARSK